MINILHLFQIFVNNIKQAGRFEHGIRKTFPRFLVRKKKNPSVKRGFVILLNCEDRVNNSSIVHSAGSIRWLRLNNQV
jgi:hypothetical protein